MAQNLEILETIGRGRYGDVRKALYKGSLVAVKTFYTTDEESWKNERDIYQTTMLNHKNILRRVYLVREDGEPFRVRGRRHLQR